jgi:hypothetical protein
VPALPRSKPTKRSRRLVLEGQSVKSQLLSSKLRKSKPAKQPKPRLRRRDSRRRPKPARKKKNRSRWLLQTDLPATAVPK